MPPLPLDPEERDPALSRATKRLTVDFSLLTVPRLHDLLQDSDADNDKKVDGDQEENVPIQVFSLTSVWPLSFHSSSLSVAPGVIPPLQSLSRVYRV